MPDTERLRHILVLLDELIDEFDGLTLREADERLGSMRVRLRTVRRWGTDALYQREQALASAAGGAGDVGNGTAK